MIPAPLVHYNAALDIVGTLDAQTVLVSWAREHGVPVLGILVDGVSPTNDYGEVLALVDFAAFEVAGGENTVTHRLMVPDEDGVNTVRGSKVWPEWIGGAALQFRVELEGSPGARRISALVHKVSGYRRERVVLEAEIDRRISVRRAEAEAKAVAIRSSMPVPRDVQGRFLPKLAVVVEAEPADIRDLVGGSDAPLELDPSGKTIPVLRRPLT